MFIPSCKKTSYVEILIPVVMVSEGEAFGGDWVMRVEFSRMGLVLLKRLSAFPPCGTTVRKFYL
jgi:hypothetical protein